MKMRWLKTLPWRVLLLCALGCGPTWPAAYQPYAPSDAEQQWDRAFALERAGETNAAAAAFDALCQQESPYVRACYDRVRVSFSFEDLPTAHARAEAFVLQHPEHALAPSAVDWMLEGAHTSDERLALIARLQTLAGNVQGTDVWDSILYRIARLFAQLHDAEREREALLQIRALGRWHSQLYDDAMWRLISLAAEAGDSSAEEALLREFVATIETSWLIGSYHSRWHDHALQRLGDLLKRNGDARAAFRVYRQLGRWHTSRLRASGLLHAAEMAHQLQRRRTACRYLQVLLVEEPDSRLCAAAMTQREAFGCLAK